MLKIIFPLLILISVSAITLTASSQNVTNDISTNLFVAPISEVNESRNITIIAAVGDLECSKSLHDRIKKDNVTIFIALGDLCYKRDLTNCTTTHVASNIGILITI